MLAAESLAAQLAVKPPMALRYAKAALIGGLTARSAAQTDLEGRCFAAVWGSHEWEQGLKKLFSRRARTEP
jgi:enoyl-CoA hydratase/carnithine racemase